MKKTKPKKSKVLNKSVPKVMRTKPSRMDEINDQISSMQEMPQDELLQDSGPNIEMADPIFFIATADGVNHKVSKEVFECYERQYAKGYKTALRECGYCGAGILAIATLVILALVKF